MAGREGGLFVGRLSKNTRTRDVEEVFEAYGRMIRCEVKYGAEMAYAFVDFEDRRDAEDALKYENGKDLCGSNIIVEWARGNPRQPRRGGGSYRGGGRDDYRRGGGGRGGDSRRSPPRRRRRSRSPRRRRSRSRSGSFDGRRRRPSFSKSRSRSRSRSRSSNA